jgi:hypothetical protein
VIGAQVKSPFGQTLPSTALYRPVPPFGILRSAKGGYEGGNYRTALRTALGTALRTALYSPPYKFGTAL